MRLPVSSWIDVGVKALFVVLVAYGAFSGGDQFEGKGYDTVSWWDDANHFVATAYRDTLGD